MSTGTIRSLVLRLTALVALVQAIGHGALFLTARPASGSAADRVISAMRSESFDYGLLGFRTYWDMYFGYGIITIVLALGLAALIWVAAGIGNLRQQRQLVAVIGAIVAAHAVVVFKYFFLLPFVFDLVVLVGLCLFLLLAFFARDEREIRSSSRGEVRS
jgi:hypothetical protein